ALREHGDERFLPAHGMGAAAGPKRGMYRHPKEPSDKRPVLGDEYFLQWHERPRLLELFANTDFWKTSLHEALACDPDADGSITVFEPVEEHEHKILAQLAKHLTSERAIEVQQPGKQKGKGLVTVWFHESRAANHWLDALYWCVVAAHRMGVKFVEREAAPVVNTEPLLPEIVGADGRAVRLRTR
ncbi:MAG: hypothetical protein KDA37_07485, partial [Planctomycetales bacterium]|nr:hypothetical protein [Planctomycetales bacterium]